MNSSHTLALHLRPVAPADCQLIWEWSNEPAVRSVSFSTEPIPWPTHQQWFQAKLADPACLFYLALNLQAIPVGQVRYDLTADCATISVSIASQFRNCGYGTALIQLACQTVFRSTTIERIVAYVKPDNPASMRTFLKAGFHLQVELVLVKEHPARCLLLNRP